MNKWLFLVFALVTNLATKAQISDFENINFKDADKIADFYKGNDLTNLAELSYNLTHRLPTEVEKFRAIYTWVSTNIASDYSNYRKNYINRSKFQKDSLKLNQWNKTFTADVFKKLLKEKKTVCTGYAYLVKKLANLSNINCNIIDGYGRIESSIDNEFQFPNHSWNAVQLNNKWYLCDATWSSGSYDMNNYTFNFNYNDGYFLANPELFAKNHFPMDTSWFLLNEKPLLYDFSRAPLLYGGAFVYTVFPVKPSSMFLEIEKNKEAVFLLKELKSTDTKSIALHIVSGNDVETIHPETERTKEGFIRIKYTFTSRGVHDVHFKIKDDFICTYVVNVKKE